MKNNENPLWVPVESFVEESLIGADKTSSTEELKNQNPKTGEKKSWRVASQCFEARPARYRYVGSCASGECFSLA